MGKELEVKYRVPDAETLEAVLAWAMLPVLRVGEPCTLEMETTYFDTQDGLFSARMWTVRRRMENGHSIFCVKTPRDDPEHPLLRGEWEAEAASFGEALPLLLAEGAPPALSEVDPASLVSVCGAKFTRRAQLLRLSGKTSCELACDLGTLRGGTREAPLCELELELKSGDEQELYAFAQMLAVCFRLEREPKSKFARARALCESCMK